MNQCVEELDWEALGRVMIAKWKIVFETLHGFIQTFDFSALGDAFACATMATINNIDWPQAAADLVSGAAGLLEALAHWIDGLDWQQDVYKRQVLSNVVTVSGNRCLGLDVIKPLLCALDKITDKMPSKG